MRFSQYLARDRGAGAFEYVAAVVVGMVIVGTIVTVAIPGTVQPKVAAAVCQIFGGEDCGDPGDPNAGENPGGSPNETPSPSGTPCLAFCPTAENPIVPTDPVVAATKGNYVALGDSYSSGEGAIDYDPATTTDANRCHRSRNAYSQHVGDRYDFADGTSFFACSGAKVDNLLRGQYDEPAQITANPNLNQRTTLVTLSIGGNDLGFADVISACAKDLHIHWPWENPPDQCHAQNDGVQQKMRELFEPPGRSKYDRLIDTLHQQAPNARIVVVGYPLLFPEPPEHGWVNFTKDDQRFLNGLGRQLNERIEAAVRRADERYYGNGRQKMGSVEFVDPTPAFEGHEVSNLPWDEPWIHPIWVNCRDQSFNTENLCINPGSFHPTEEGQRAMANVVNEQIRNGPGRTLYDP